MEDLGNVRLSSDGEPHFALRLRAALAAGCGERQQIVARARASRVGTRSGGRRPCHRQTGAFINGRTLEDLLPVFVDDARNDGDRPRRTLRADWCTRINAPTLSLRCEVAIEVGANGRMSASASRPPIAAPPARPTRDSRERERVALKVRHRERGVDAAASAIARPSDRDPDVVASWLQIEPAHDSPPRDPRLRGWKRSAPASSTPVRPAPSNTRVCGCPVAARTAPVPATRRRASSPRQRSALRRFAAASGVAARRRGTAPLGTAADKAAVRPDVTARREAFPARLSSSDPAP